MKCPGCGFDNRDGIKFCEDCGAKLELACPGCMAKIPLGRKYCGECGHNLTSHAETTLPLNLTFEEKLAKLQRYLPSGLVEKVLLEKDKIEGERRQVTIMFVDMKGFTPLTEVLGPEVTFSLMDEVFELLIHKVHDFQGTVSELRGDGILAFFGAPLALEDAPQRAIRSALAIHRGITIFSEKACPEKDIPPIQLRIGINSGPVVVGSVGNDLRVQFTAVGETINLAARMEQLAEPGTTYVSDETFKLTEGFFRFEALGEKEIKGKKEPVNVYRVIAPSSRRTRFDVSAEKGLTRFIGRQKELEILLDCFDRAKSGRGQAVSIVGEAGIGKSRLLYEFRKAVSNEDITFLEGKCLFHSKGISYHPIIDLLRSNFGIEDEDTDFDVTEKVKKGLAILAVDESSTLPYLLELLTAKDSGVNSYSMSPAEMKNRILESLKRIVLKGAEKRPLVLAIEDLHLIDKSSEESAKHLLMSIPGARVLLILTYRPEFIHTWGAKSFHSQVTLNRLSNRESLAIVEHMLQQKQIADDLQELILEKTEGIPFFIEEFVKALSEMQIIKIKNDTYHLVKDVAHVDIPSTVQDVIMARVDALPETTKSVLQAGSAIEREFSFELIGAVTGFPERILLSHLSALKELELIYERGIYPQSTYVFKHAITREVIYDSILTKRKKLLHQKIGTAIEESNRDNLDAYHIILAHHFFVSQNYLKSAEYSRLAHEKARKQAALSTAIFYAEKRIEALEKIPKTTEVEQHLIDARTYHGLSLCLLSHYAEAKKTIEPIVEINLTKNDKRRQAQIYFILGSYQYIIEEDFEYAFQLLQKAIESAESAADIITATQAHVFYGLALCWRCQFNVGAEHIQRALLTNETAQILWGISFLNSNLSYYVFNYQGKVAKGFETSLNAMDIAERSGDIFSRAVAYVCHGISCYYKGFFAEAREHLFKGLDLCEQITLHSFSAAAHQALGYVYFQAGAFDKSQTHHQQAILKREQSGIFPSCINLNKIALARAALASGQTGCDIKSLKQLHKTNRLKLYDGAIARHLAAILSQLGNAHFTEAEFWIERAILEHQQSSMMWDLASDYMLMAQMMKSRGQITDERKYTDKAQLLFNECGADGWCRKIESDYVKD